MLKEKERRMEVRLRAVVTGGIRAVTFRNGVRRSVIYLVIDTVAYEQAAPPADESPTNPDEESEAPGRWWPFAGWYQIPRVGTAAVYWAVIEAELLALA